MSEKILSVFIDESVDFGPFEAHSPYYLVSMILHNQNTDITENIKSFDSHLIHLGYSNHAIAQHGDVPSCGDAGDYRPCQYAEAGEYGI